MDHSSINHIKAASRNQFPSVTSSSNFCSTDAEEMFNFLSVLDTKKVVGFDMIPPKLVKIAVSVLCQPLSNAIDNSLSNGFFLDDVKIAVVSTRDKGKRTRHKNDMTKTRY